MAGGRLLVFSLPAVIAAEAPLSLDIEVPFVVRQGLDTPQPTGTGTGTGAGTRSGSEPLLPGCDSTHFPWSPHLHQSLSLSQHPSHPSPSPSSVFRLWCCVTSNDLRPLLLHPPFSNLQPSLFPLSSQGAYVFLSCHAPPISHWGGLPTQLSRFLGLRPPPAQRQ